MSTKPSSASNDAPPPYQAGPSIAAPTAPGPAPGPHAVYATRASDAEAARCPYPHERERDPFAYAAARRAALGRFWGAMLWAFAIYICAGLILGGGIADASRQPRTRPPTQRHRHSGSGDSGVWHDDAWAHGRGAGGAGGAGREVGEGYIVGEGTNLGEGYVVAVPAVAP